jgi:hypothetical protein
MTQNLYDFLRKIVAEGKDFKASPSDIVWAKGFLENSEIEISFKATKIDETTTGLPIMRCDFSYKGEPVELFELIVEAGFQNGEFAELISAAASFFSEHVPNCPDCKTKHGSEKCARYRVRIIPVGQQGDDRVGFAF